MFIYLDRDWWKGGGGLLERDLGEGDDGDEDDDGDGDGVRIAFCEEDVGGDFVADVFAEHEKACYGDGEVEEVLGIC